MLQQWVLTLILTLTLTLTLSLTLTLTLRLTLLHEPNPNPNLNPHYKSITTMHQSVKHSLGHGEVLKHCVTI